MPPLRRWAAGGWGAALVCGAIALLSSAFLFGTPLDEEELRFAVLSAWLRARSLVHGAHPFWSSQLGLGLPQPFVPNFCLHPFMLLLAVLSPVAWVRLILFAHTVLGAIGMWLVCRRLKLAEAVAAACVVTYLLAAPAQNYVLTDFWPSHYVVWTSVPWILLLAWRLLENDRDGSWRSGAALGLVTGLTIASSNPSYAAVYAVFPIGMLTRYGRAIRKQWAALGVAVVIAAAIVSPIVIHLIVERHLFPPDLGLSNVQEPLLLRGVLKDLWRPLGEVQDARTFFIGAPFTLLALLGCAWVARSDLVVAAGIAAVMLFTAWVPASIVSQRYQFRDPLTLCAILLAGSIADRWWRSRRRRPLAALTLLVQTIAVAAAAWPFIEHTWTPDGLRASVLRGATADTPFADQLVAAMRSSGRLAYTPRIDHAVSERALVDDGLGLNALAYRDVAVVNGSFKGVATDVLWPNDRLFYGWVRTPQALVDSDASLDALGIRYVLAYGDEHVASGLRKIWSGTTIREAELVLLENPDASNGAFLIDPALVDQKLPSYPGCGHDRLLCKDVGTFAKLRNRDVTTIEHRSNEIRMTWPPAPERLLLVVTEMYRPAWTARAGNETLEAHSVYGGFIGVSIPAGVSSLQLRYRPSAIIAASIACYAAIVLALGALALGAGQRWTQRRSASRDISQCR